MTTKMQLVAPAAPRCRYVPLVVVVSVVLAATTGCSSTDEPASDESAPRVIGLDTIAHIHHDGFFHVNGAHVAGNKLYVSNAGAYQVLVFDLQGRLESEIGRVGQGPGEFRSVTDIAVRGDSVLVLDALGRRLTLFNGTEVLETLSLPPANGPYERVYLRSDGVVLLASRLRARPPSSSAGRSTLVTDSVQLVEVRLRWSGVGDYRTILSFEGSEEVHGVGPNGSWWRARPPFGSGTFYAVSDRGVMMADGRSGRIVFVDESGLSRTLVEAKAPAAVSADEMALWKADLERRMRRLPDPAEAKALADLSLAAWRGFVPRPVFSRLVGGGAFYLIQEYAYGLDAGAWRVLDDSGGLDARILIPPDVRPVSVSGDTILAIRRDSLDVESILVLRLRQAYSATLESAPLWGGGL